MAVLRSDGEHYNYFRDYDPAIGRYVESDPIGLRGGLSTYGYVGANPIQYSDAEGLLIRGQSLTDGEWGRAQDAESRIRKELGKACVCSVSGNDGCIPCELYDGLRNALNTSVMSKSPKPKICGEAPVNGKWITITQAGFTNPGCGCLALSIYHELLHNAGLSHKDPGDPVDKLDRNCRKGLCK
jgi:hypothetical protein